MIKFKPKANIIITVLTALIMTIIINLVPSTYNVANASKADRINQVVQLMQESYKGDAEVYYDSENKVIVINPNSPEFVDEMNSLIDGDYPTSDWHKLTKSIDKVSKTVSKQVKNQPVALVNPVNTDKVLYVSVNGVAFYDFMDEN